MRAHSKSTSHFKRGGILGKVLGLLVVSVVGVWGFLHAGTFLVVEDGFESADVALILSGDPMGRSLAARDLYRQGRVQSILVIPEPPNPLEDELSEIGLVETNRLPLSQRILEASGVPRTKIKFLANSADGTFDEAQSVKRGFQRAGIFPDSLALITSPYASRRARFIFRNVLRGPSIQVHAYPDPYEAFSSQQWWTKPRNALDVVMEYHKFAVNLIQVGIDRFSEIKDRKPTS